ncbi:hypothetical protein NP493_27g03016 [Ridgeia piscesae]|uniref:Uncharacterized protein n=1 Tax=Ridgeia piscesae TaxID=27915 RepID=A0AAD9UK94_RIDPI|nr:hypothetical protein NP493_27g03016 [Ridgeia piscesae]
MGSSPLRLMSRSWLTGDSSSARYGRKSMPRLTGFSVKNLRICRRTSSLKPFTCPPSTLSNNFAVSVAQRMFLIGLALSSFHKCRVFSW